MSVHCMSNSPQTYPNPFSAHTFPTSFISNSDINLATWNYRLLRSLQVLHTNLPLIHQPYYRPFSSLWEGYVRPPFSIAADHYFEWRSSIHNYPICVVLISNNPLFRFSAPQVINSNHSIYQCPVIHILWWDYPRDIPVTVCEFIFDLDELIDDGLTDFLFSLDASCVDYYTPLTPFQNPVSIPIQLQPSPPISPSNTNPNTIPLVHQQ